MRTHTLPSPNQICLGRTPQHRLARPSHTKPSLQPPDQLCSLLSTGRGAGLRRGGVLSVQEWGSWAFLQSSFSAQQDLGAGGSIGPPPPLALLILSLATHRARISMETIKEARAYQYQGPPHWGLAWWFLSLHTKGRKMKPPWVVTDLRSHLVG